MTLLKYRNRTLLASMLSISSCIFHAAYAATARRPTVLPLDQPITVQMEAQPLRTFLESVSAQSHGSFIVIGGIGKIDVTADCHNLALKIVLQRVLEPLGLAYRQTARSGTYLIGPEADIARIASRPNEFGRNPALNARLNIDVEEVSLRTLLKQISAQSNINFIIAPGLDRKRITARLNNVTTREALESLGVSKNLDIHPDDRGSFLVAPSPVVP